MDRTSLKRRRPHFYGDDSYELYNQTGFPLPSDAIAAYTTNEQFTLQQAATILELPQQDLYCLAPPYYNSYITERAAGLLQSPPEPAPSDYLQQAHPKRQRQYLDFTWPSMPPQYTSEGSGEGLEKLVRSTSFTSSHAYSHQRPAPLAFLPDGGSFLASTVECFAGLATCYGSSKDRSSSEQEGLLASSATAATAPPGSTQPSSSCRSQAGIDRPGNPGPGNQPYFDDLGTPHVDNWLSGDGSDSTQYMPSYPALQPTVMAPTTTPAGSKLTKVQPTTHEESMYYPGGELSSMCLKQEDGGGGDPITANTVAPVVLSAPSHAPQLLHTPVQQQPAGGVVFAGGSCGLTATNYHHLAVQPMVNAGGDPVSVSADNALRPTSAVLPSPATLSTVVAPSYTHMPHAVAQHLQEHHHHMYRPVPITTYMAVSHAETADAPQRRLLSARRGPFRDQTIRQKTAQTRKNGSCIRCRMQRIRCNADDDDAKGQCLGCKKLLNRMWHLPCMRLKINDVVLAKTTQVKGHEWTLRWKDNTVLDSVGQWASGEVRLLRITEGYTNGYVELRVREFVPQDGDSLSRSWVTPDGKQRSVQIPAYAVIEPESIAPLYSAYIRKGISACCKNVLAGLENSLIWPTYCKALQLSHTAGMVSEQEQKVLLSVLELWVSVRLTTRSFEIVGDETLGMPKDILDETNPSYGKVPIPPVMGAQLDSVLIHQIQHNLRRVALERLWEIVNESKTKTWVTIYLSTFILLHNAALIIKHDASYAKKHGINRRFARPDKVQEYYTGAITLLAYFHYCNKGSFPFTKAARESEMRNIASLDDAAMQFVRDTRAAAIKNKADWQKLWDTDAYEDDFYFISQMYEENWQPRAMRV